MRKWFFRLCYVLGVLVGDCITANYFWQLSVMEGNIRG